MYKHPPLTRGVTCFSALQWCKNDMHSVATILQILNFHIFQSSDMLYYTLKMLGQRP